MMHSKHGGTDMSKRTFIVAPTEAGKDLGDTLHQVCQTEGKGCYFDIY